MAVGRRLRDLLYRLRTEGSSPPRLGAAVALGVFVGCSPLYGLHLLICVGLARLFGLSRGLTYLAANISTPGIWPFLVFAEIQVGRWLRGAGRLPLRVSELKQLDPWQFGLDALLGSLVVGAALAVPLGLATYGIARLRRRRPEVHAIVEATAKRYVGRSMFDWEFVRGKLRNDPVYLQILRQGLLPSSGVLLDLGCGRGILLSLLATARSWFAEGRYPEEWAAPPELALRGIEVAERAAAAAQAALGADAEIRTADLSACELAPVGSLRAIVLLDVLHYLPPEAQTALLDRAADALAPGGVVLIREADAAGGWSFTATRIQERFCAMARRHWRQRFRYRSTAEWSELLGARGLRVTTQPMSMGTPYANVLIVATRPA